jgi:CRP-like cAMP-binding protein
MNTLVQFFNSLYPLSPAIIKGIEDKSAPLRYSQGETIDKIAEAPIYFLHVKSGLLKSMIRNGLSYKVNNFLGPNDPVFDVANLFRPVRIIDHFQAIHSTEAYAIPYDALYNFLQADPNFLFPLLKLVDLRLDDFRRRSNLLSDNISLRIRSFSRQYSDLIDYIPRHDICDYLCITSATYAAYEQPKVCH